MVYAFALLVTLTLAAWAAPAQATIELTTVFHVATNGSDSWSGRLPEPNNQGTDGPFATLERARDAVRALKNDTGNSGGPPSAFTIRIRKGTYFLDRPFVLASNDTGSPLHPITYGAFPGERVVISGGKRIEGFREVEVNGRKMLAADLPEVKVGKWHFTQLFVNGRRRPRTRMPKNGCYQIAELVGVTPETLWHQGQDSFRFNDGEIRQWNNLADVDVVALHFWVDSRMPIKSVDESTHTVSLAKRSVFRLTSDFGTATGARYYVENVFEALDTPGQWYLDSEQGILYYHPFEGEDVKNLSVVAPKLEQLLRVEGADDAHKVTNIMFENLRFAHTEYALPPDSAGASQAAVSVPAALYFGRAGDCAVTNCEIAHIGTYAVDFGAGCQDCRFERNSVYDMGAGGVKINHGSEGTTVADNEIGDGGKIFNSAVGVWVGNSPRNNVVHNHIHDLNYTGVSLGWVWGYGDSKAVENHIDFNHIHHIGRGVLSDLGGVYSLGVSPGTTVRNNLIHDSLSHGYGGWGIYTDEGSSQMLIEDNIVYRTKTGGFHQHYGKENKVRNNIFAFAKIDQLQRTRLEPHTSFFFERNIVYYNEGNLLGSNWGDNNYKMDYNLYYDAGGRPVTFAGAGFDDWKKRGHDVHSLIADPMFVDPYRGNFALKPHSPAFGLGFKQIDASRVGPRVPVGPP